MIPNNNDTRLKQAWQPYASMWHRLEVPAKTVLLKEGAVASKLYYITKGAVRVWFHHNGKEISFQFFFEGDVVCSVESFSKRVPGSFYIETMEACALRWISKTDLDKVVEENPAISKYMMSWAIDKQAVFIKHFFAFLKDTPQQRYRDLLEQQPQIIQRVALQYIASYLGITPVSLSRIRNKI